MRLTLPALALALFAAPCSLLAENIFVNNATGLDRNDGSAAETVGTFAGPVRTISRALQLAKPSDAIVLANSGTPYFDEVTIDGRRLSGTEVRPFRIVGNGAVLSGAMTLPPGAWEEVGRDLWRVRPHRKGHYQLLRDGAAVSEVRQGADENWTELPELAENQWCVWKGAIYLHAEHNADPGEQNFGIARGQCGITLHAVRHVRISDLTIQHYRLDGINVHDRASDVTLSNVALVENGRSGLTVTGSSTVRIAGAETRANREHSMLIQEAAAVDVQETVFDAEPTVR
jgi:nitrous oxidase accessory protein NosD